MSDRAKSRPFVLATWPIGDVAHHVPSRQLFPMKSLAILALMGADVEQNRTPNFGANVDY